MFHYIVKVCVIYTHSCPCLQFDSTTKKYAHFINDFAAYLRLKGTPTYWFCNKLIISSFLQCLYCCNI